MRQNIERLADEAVDSAEDDIQIASEVGSICNAGYIRDNYRIAVLAAMRASETVPEFADWYRENIDVDTGDE